jgi:hypothetical protein
MRLLNISELSYLNGWRPAPSVRVAGGWSGLTYFWCRGGTLRSRVDVKCSLGLVSSGAAQATRFADALTAQAQHFSSALATTA